MNKLFVIVGLAVLLLHSSCKHENEHGHETLPTYPVTHPMRKDTLISREYVAQIKSIRHIELRALERGYLKNISVDEGQYVKKGQLMFTIMPNVYEAELKKAEAEARVAEIEYENTRLLAESDVVSPNELAMAKANYEKAEAEVALARTHLNFTSVRAPFSGIMDHLEVREGSLLDEGELLTSLSDNTSMWIYFNVPESEYLDYITDIKKDSLKQVKLLLANNKVFNQTGIVETIEGEFNNETGNIAFRATFPNPDKILRHGETGNILMDIPMQDALLIPQKATFELLEKKYVFVVDENNTVRQREITIAEELPHLYAVEDGLQENDRILLEGLRKVREGDHIETSLDKPDNVFAHLYIPAE